MPGIDNKREREKELRFHRDPYFEVNCQVISQFWCYSHISCDATGVIIGCR